MTTNKYSGAVILLSLCFFNNVYALTPLCPTITAVKNSQLDSNTHDNYGIWNLFGRVYPWVILVGNIKTDSLSKANVIAQNALSNIDKVSGPFLSQNHWVCKYTPEPANGYYVVTWKQN